MGADSHRLHQKLETMDKEKLKEAFEKADAEKTGKVTLKQFQEILLASMEDEDERKMCQNQGFVDGIMFALDVNEDGELTLEEIMKYADGFTEEQAIKSLKRWLENGDKDKDGFLTAKELKGVLMMMQPGEDESETEDMIDFMIRMCGHNDSKEKAKVMFRMFDTNLDGYLDKKELVGYMNQLSGDDEEDKEGDKAMEMLMKMMIAKFDEDEDGKLNFEEFEKFLEEN